jgi:acyl-CoA thioester hydrolase
VNRISGLAATRRLTEAGAGAPCGPCHTLSLRVYYEDTDAAGIVYYANYLKFAERGRTEMMRGLGFAHSRVQAETGLVFSVRRCAVDYRAAARLDDALSVETRVAEIGAATLLLDQRICRAGDIIAALDVLIACVARDGRPRRIPAALRAALLAFSQSAPPLVLVQKTP